MDSRLIVKIGKQEFMRSSCVGECAGCPKQFTPVPPEDGKTFCRAYLDPAAKWTGKTCPFMYKPELKKEQKINPAKASRRRINQAASQVVAVATGSKESGKKTERRDSR